MRPVDLRRLQTAMARKLTLGQAVELPADEADYLASIPEAALDAFSSTLFRKRLNAIRKLLPLSAKQETFHRLFRDWVAHHPPDEYRKEAQKFAFSMQNNAFLTLFEREIYRFEATGWDCVLKRRFRAGLFRVRILSGGPGYTLAVWTRPGDRRPWLREF